MRYSEMLRSNAPAERAKRMPLLDDDLYPPRQIVRQGPYNGYKPDRTRRRTYPAFTVVIETNRGWHTGVVLRDSHVILRLKALRNRDEALERTLAAMRAMKDQVDA